MEISGYPVRNSQVIWQNIDDNVVIADPDGGTLRILNETAGFIWSLVDGTKTTEDIIPDLCERFDVEPEQARADVLAFCQELIQAELLHVQDKSN
jgi:hypothetical protein